MHNLKVQNEESATEQKWCPGSQDLRISWDLRISIGFHRDFKISQRSQDFTEISWDLTKISWDFTKILIDFTKIINFMGSH